jgi:tetratricopeptide (TPR) repeat protein
MTTQREQLGERVGEAWRLHRYGDNQAALDIFEDLSFDAPADIEENFLDDLEKNQRDAIIAEWVNYIDALYGFGLATRTEGNEEKAVKIFRRALSYTDKVLAALGVRDIATGSNELDSFADDRFIMLRRMITQRMEELGATPTA